MEGMGHGEWLRSEEGGAQLIASVQALRREAASIGAAEAAVRTVASTATDVTRSASATLLSATAPLASTLTPLATTYEQALAEAALAAAERRFFFSGRWGPARRRNDVSSSANVGATRCRFETRGACPTLRASAKKPSSAFLR